MGTIETLSKMFFIMDSSGNYYRLDSDDQLVVADGKEDAVFFTYEEADMRIGSGKRSHFYQIVQAAESTGISDDGKESDSSGGIADREAEREKVVLPPEADPEKAADTEEDYMTDMEDAGEEMESSSGTDCRETADEAGNEPEHDAGMSHGKVAPLKRWSSEELADLSGIDWLMYLQNFSYIVANIREYREQVNAELSKAERTLCDLLHFVEFFDPDVCQAKGIMDRIKEAREYRRDVKNELYRIDQFRAAIGNNNNAGRVNEAVRSILKLEKAGYRPRVLSDLFREAPKEERREIRSFKEMVQRYEQADPDNSCEEFSYEDTGEGVFEEMDWERRDTIYDSREVDWDAFVKEQADFYRNARQHIINLGIDIERLDAEIEDLLVRCEEESCNVTQGYKMFRKLKDLRIEKKEKALQLQKVSAIADRFDCDVMREIFEEVEEELGLTPSPDIADMGQAEQGLNTDTSLNLPEESCSEEMPVSVSGEEEAARKIQKAV